MPHNDAVCFWGDLSRTSWTPRPLVLVQRHRPRSLGTKTHDLILPYPLGLDQSLSLPHLNPNPSLLRPDPCPHLSGLRSRWTMP